MFILKSQKWADGDLLEFALARSKQSGGIREKLLHWDFGPVMEMKLEEEAKNYLFSAEAVPFHWDGAFHKVPAELVFYCTESEGKGGETIFTNTTALWESLSKSERELCSKVQLCYRTKKLAHYGGEIRVSMVQKHAHTDAVILRLAEEVTTQLNPVELEISGIDHPREFYREMRAKLYDPRFLYEHSWEKGDVLVCDNYTYLHGRRPLGENRKRSFKRVQVL